MLLLLPNSLLKMVLKEFGNPDGNDWFAALGESIDKYYTDNKSTMFSHLSRPEKPGTSLDALKKSLGYVAATREFNSDTATGAKRYVREVLSKKYAEGLTWSQYLESIGLKEQALLPLVSHSTRAKVSSFKTVSKHDEEAEVFNVNCDAIAGYWLSRFEYISKSGKTPTSGYQIDIERLDKEKKASFSGTNLAITSPSGKKYEHKLMVQLFGDFLVGYWKNTNTKNIGAFQLTVYTNMCVMTGLHLGNANDNTIQSGVWTWIKIVDQPSDEIDLQISNASLKAPEILTELMEKWEMNGDPIRLSDVLI